MIADLQLQIKNLAGEIDTLNLKRSGEDRDKEKKEFQLEVADQRASQKLLTAALDIFKEL